MARAEADPPVAMAWRILPVLLCILARALCQQCPEGEFQRPSDGACQVAKVWCKHPDKVLATCCKHGILRMHTQNGDAECLDAQHFTEDDLCLPGYYLLRRIVRDDLGFVQKPPLCRPISQCPNTHYEIRPYTQYENRACAPITVCDQSTQFTSLPSNGFRDAACQARTVCRYDQEEVLLTAGSATTDNVCGMEVACNPRTEFVSSKPRNATTAQPQGSPGACSGLTVCPRGTKELRPPALYTDRECVPCPPGSHGVDFDTLGKGGCIPCVTGLEFSATGGNESCQPCRDCLSDTEAVLTGHNRSYQSLCTSTRDAVCMSCPPEWRVARGTGVCAPCARGYFLLPGLPRSCVPCPKNGFCETESDFSVCPGLRAFKQADNTIVYIPSSPAMSSRVDDCTCHLAGGFEGQGGSLVGCRPCAAGSFAAPGSLQCEACPEGSYPVGGTMVGYRDLYNYPFSGTLPVEVLRPDGSQVPSSRGSQGLQNVLLGATSCRVCPSKHTRRHPALSASDCTPCGKGQYFSGEAQGCVPCSPECQTPGSYQVSGCTDHADRICAPCSLSCTGAGLYTRGCPGPPHSPRDGCGQCSNLPLQHAHFLPAAVPVSGPGGCPWACDEGFYAPLGSGVCLPCTVLGPSDCPPSMILSPCARDRDASCLLQCKNRTMPLRNALYTAAPPGSPPCQWECMPGFVQYISPGGLHHCIASLGGG